MRDEMPPRLRNKVSPDVLPEPVRPEDSLQGAEGFTNSAFTNLNVKSADAWPAHEAIARAEREGGWGKSKGGAISSITSGGPVRIPKDGGPDSKNQH